MPREAEPHIGLRLTDDGAEASGTAASLVRRIREGDESAWADLVALYTPRIFALCASRLRSRELAEEITQSVFVTLATKLTPGTDDAAPPAYVEEGKFEPWLFRVTMNRVRDEARRAKRQARPTDPVAMPEAPTPERAAPTGEDRAFSVEVLTKLRAAVEELPDQDRSMIELRHFANMSFQAISELLEAPLGTVLARHHRALKKLRTTLGNMGLDASFLDERSA